MGQGLDAVIFVGIAVGNGDRQAGDSLGDGGDAVHGVVGITGAEGVGLAGGLGPGQHAPGGIAEGGNLAQGIGGGGQAAEGVIGGVGLDGLGGGAGLDGGVEALGSIAEGGLDAGGRGGGGDVVVAVVAIGIAGAGGQGHLGQVVIGPFIGGGLLEDIGSGGDVALGIIDEAVAEFLLEELDIIEPGGVGVMLIGDHDADLGIGLLGDDLAAGELPAGIGDGIRI